MNNQILFIKRIAPFSRLIVGWNVVYLFFLFVTDNSCDNCDNCFFDSYHLFFDYNVNICFFEKYDHTKSILLPIPTDMNLHMIGRMIKG